MGFLKEGDEMSKIEIVRDAESVTANEILVSADSHIMEPTDLWGKHVPGSLKDKIPKFGPRRSANWKPGGHDPKARLEEMAVDGVTVEVLYPTLGLHLYGLEDAEAQETCFRISNDWLIEYCRVAPDRLVGIPLISLYKLDSGIRELERCKKEGLKGALIWQVPPEHLSFPSDYYDPFWEVAQDLGTPVNFIF
jgi:predicted TIM-barrel fold metal-dependent hydrolase